MTLRNPCSCLWPMTSDIFKTYSAGLQTPCGFLWRKIKDQQHKMLDIFHTSSSFKIILLINEALLDLAKELWQIPASIHPTCKPADKKYYLPVKDAEFLFLHPTPNSLVVSLVQERGQYQPCASHPDRVWKCLTYLDARHIHQPCSSFESQTMRL